MSVINRMLSQLDERRAAAPEAPGTGAAGAVEAVPPTVSRRLSWMVLSGAALVSATAFGHWSGVPGLLGTPAHAPQPVVIAPDPVTPSAPTAVAEVTAVPSDPLPTAAAHELSPTELRSPSRVAAATTAAAEIRSPTDAVPTALAIRTATLPMRLRSHTAEHVAALSAVRTPAAHAPAAAAVGVASPLDNSSTVAMAAPTASPVYAPTDSGSVEKRMIPPSAAQRATLAYQQAIGLAASGHSTPAIAQALEALKADPDHIAARELAAALMMETHRLGDAAALMREGLSRQPQQPHLIMLVARIEAETGETQAALARLSAAPGLDSEGHGLRAALLARAERYPEAASAYEAAVRLQPDNATWWFGLGVSLDANGQPALARQALQRARAIGSLRGDALAYVDQKLAN